MKGRKVRYAFKLIKWHAIKTLRTEAMPFLKGEAQYYSSKIWVRIGKDLMFCIDSMW